MRHKKDSTFFMKSVLTLGAHYKSLAIRKQNEEIKTPERLIEKFPNEI